MSGKQQGTIMKKLDGNEDQCFIKLMKDELAEFVPKYYSTVTVNGEQYLELQDLLAGFTNPSIMDIKMGTRTYLESELQTASDKQKLRKDMYEKMVAVDPNAPTAKEHEQMAVLKSRYMQWREELSSTSTLGFRIDGVKLTEFESSQDNVQMTKSINFKRTKKDEDVQAAIEQFSCYDPVIIVSSLKAYTIVRLINLIIPFRIPT